jgi:DNA/RNA endonuclease YhcR with UshA esterase domain
LGAFSTNAATVVRAEDAGGHVGETATVCGIVASAKFAPGSHSQPTFLDLGKPYPNPAFTAVIFGDDRPKFGTPETTLRGKWVCVTGQIRDYRGKPEIILDDKRIRLKHFQRPITMSVRKKMGNATATKIRGGLTIWAFVIGVMIAEGELKPKTQTIFSLDYRVSRPPIELII